MFFKTLCKTLQRLEAKERLSYLNDFVMIESDNRVNPIRAGNDMINTPEKTPTMRFPNPFFLLYSPFYQLEKMMTYSHTKGLCITLLLFFL